MAVKYITATTSFAILCSLIWLLMGGTFLQAAGLYLISGQVAMVALICISLSNTQHNAQPSKARAPRR